MPDVTIRRMGYTAIEIIKTSFVQRNYDQTWLTQTEDFTPS